MAVDLEKLNPEQRAGALYEGGPLLVLAGAGTGKTRVITFRIARLIEAGVPAERILAVTFTNKAADEMRRRIEELCPGKGALVWAHTFHAFAVRVLRRHHELLKLPKHFTIYDQSDQKKLVVEAMKELGLEEQANKAAMYVSIISRAKDDLLDAQSYEIYAQTATDSARQTAARIYLLYQKKLDAAGALDFGDLLLKLCLLLKEHEQVRTYYQEFFLHLLVDEYQDTNHAQYVLTKTLAAKHRNICVVGDDDQCLPAGSNVMTPKGPRRIEDIREGEEVVSGLGWGRVGPSRVDKVMERPFDGTVLRIRLRSGTSLSATLNHICFARLDPVPGLHYVYLMWKDGVGYRIGTTSGVRSYKEGVLKNGIAVRANGEVADVVWILRACRDLAEARYYEQFYSIHYRLPTMVFHVRGRRMAMSQEWVDRLFRETNTADGAERLMRDLCLDRRFPHHRAEAVIRGQSNRKYLWFTAFGDTRPKKTPGSWHEHRIQLVTSDLGLRAKAEGRFPVRDGKRRTWRIETSRKDYDEGLGLAREISALDGLQVVSRARLTPNKAFHFMPASHLQPGMIVPRLEKGAVVEDVIEAVEPVRYRGRVYDLSVPDLRNYCAEGVLVHNSVYSWRGANIRNILEFERDFKDAKVVTLEQNYRSTPLILEAAHKVIRNNKARKPKKLWTEQKGGESIQVMELPNEAEEASWAVRRMASLVEQGRSLREFAIFYRTNAQSRSFEEALRRAGMAYRIVGAVRFYERREVKDALAYARVILNPADSVSLARILNVPPRGIGKTSLDRLEACALAKGLTLWDIFCRQAEVPQLTPACRKHVDDLVALIRKLNAAAAALTAAGAIARILEESGYLGWLTAETETDPEAVGRLNNLQELLNGVREYEEKMKGLGETIDLGRYLEEISLQSDLDSYDPSQPCVTLMTVHLAKGLEYPVVFLTGLEEGLFPIGSQNAAPDDLEEERRLAYVGITRARELLFMTHAATRRTFGQVYANLPSRFILEAQLSLGHAAPAAPSPEARFHPPRAGRPAPERPQPARASFRVGMRVKHPSFGLGRVLELSGSGETAKVKVRFDDGRLTKLIVRYAPLEPA